MGKQWRGRDGSAGQGAGAARSTMGERSVTGQAGGKGHLLGPWNGPIDIAATVADPILIEIFARHWPRATELEA
jgi:hypothetical protein